ncbi:MAG: hypothetical protein KIH62_000620 [Candidatus Kerfeldbacteria bacterium]|nr:hypothetical protein [Candidatus Kerfeldbacteria bacterium]
MKLNPKNSFLIGYVVVMLIFWMGMYSSSIREMEINKFWGIGINCIPLFGGLFGLYTSKKWGGFKSIIGKSLIFLSIGLLSWSLGNWVWSYYNFFLNSDVPYPSLADIGYIFAVPMWLVGVLYLSKAIGVKYALRSKVGKFYLIFLPLVSIITSYYLLVFVARAGSLTSNTDFLKMFFDLAYPIGDILIITIAIIVYVLSFKYLGGRFKAPSLFILLGFILMFFSDFSFSYTTTLGTYYDGHANNLLFVFALFFMGFGITAFDFEEQASDFLNYNQN